MFKVGDKVRRKPEYQQKGGWAYGDAIVTVGKWANSDEFYIKELTGAKWDKMFFTPVEEGPADTSLKFTGTLKNTYNIPKTPSALEDQIGGDHYKSLAIQPIEYITKNNLGWCEGNIVKYISRWKQKGQHADLDKVIHYVNLLKELST